MKGKLVNNMKEDKPVRLWKIIAPPIYYFFMQMIMESVFAISSIFKGIKGIYGEGGIVKDSQAVINEIRIIAIDNAAYIVALSALSAIVVFGRMFYNETGKEIIKDKKGVDNADVPAAIFFAVMLSLGLSNIIFTADIDNIIGSYENISRTLLEGNIVYLLVVSGILVPVAEEIMYRGLVYKRALKEFGRVNAIMISAVAFGVFHFNLVQGIYAFFIGLALAYFYDKYGDLKVSIYMHMAINIVTVLLEYYGVKNITGEEYGIRLLVMLFEFGMAASAFSLIYKKNDKKRGS